MVNPLQEIVEYQGVVILDGGLATWLEENGHKLDPHLWSAKMLIDSPDEVRRAHGSFLDAGADCITTATYQASYDGFSRFGLTPLAVDELLGHSVTLAREAVHEFLSDTVKSSGRVRPLVAASVGPYGAFLADGSEYDGRYGIDQKELVDFHERRFKVLANSSADLVAFETIPSLDEAKVLLGLLDKTSETWGWMSFSCRDGGHLRDGTPIEVAVELCENTERLVGIGINCTAPRFVNELVTRIRMRTDKLVLAYPNSGESWNAKRKKWTGSGDRGDWVEMAESWHKNGAQVIGGCCRIGPEIIREVRARVFDKRRNGSGLGS